ncbi:AMP-binding protein [Azospirillum sp. TSO35-2]|uniref:AMP-binding protein n=1 Tax=Azospirillum sp. TSO35-2 TaxID=716796 RepID=UPI000D60FC7F|nr:AMP-binding protein [Azospirillum sp. TSO35-2]PWC40032.1 acyl-CoA synthetase [Azospirillum sp. TSO35-2]
MPPPGPPLGPHSAWEAPDILAYHAAVQPRNPACVDLASGERLTYAELDRRVDRCVAWLLGRIGAEPGQRVAWLGRNSIDEVIASLACGRAGAVFVPLNWRLTAPEVAALLADSTPSLLVHDAEFAPTVSGLATAPAGLAMVTRATAHAEQAATTGPAPRLAPRDANAPSTIIYTSGTSGQPKGAIHTEQTAFFTAFNFALLNRIDHASVFLCDMPLFHVIGILTITRSTLLQGGALLVSPGFDPELTLARLSDPGLGVTHYMCVPQMAQSLRQRPEYDPTRLSRLVFFGTGGAPNPPALVRRFLAEGVPMADGYGSSEGGTVLGMPLGDPERMADKAGSAGLPPASVRLRLVDDQGNDVADGEVGEILVRGPNVSPGYWNRPPSPDEGPAGWFRTGDSARRDADGFYVIVDRKKDMFISGGENVYPAEIEAVLLELDAVAEACVIGIPDRQWGEVGCAYVVPRAGYPLTDQDIIDHCRSRLARYKAPKRVIVTDALPRTASGKLRKNVLRELHRSEQAE